MQIRYVLNTKIHRDTRDQYIRDLCDCLITYHLETEVGEQTATRMGILGSS